MGMPLSSLNVNDGGDFWSRLNNSAEDALGDISELEEFVDVKVGKYGYCPEDWTKKCDPGRLGGRWSSWARECRRYRSEGPLG